MGDKVEFAKDFSLYLTYRHRKSSIAGGDIEEMDFDEEVPNTGFLSNYREEDGRIPTPAIEIGAITSRFRHIGVANIPRVTSEYGYEMRSLFSSGEGFIFFGFDYSSLENRVMAHYVLPYPKGEELAEEFIAEKPNDFHSKQANRLGIDRSDCKSVNYGILYGSQIAKIMQMLGVDKKRASEIFNGFWDGAPALRDLKENVEKYWEKNNEEYIKAIDGRKVLTRSRHSLLNSLFQSGGVILAKYVEVMAAEEMEKKGLIINPFVGKPDVCTMISYHDEQDLACNPSLFKFKRFNSEEEAKKFIVEWDGEQLSAIGHGSSWYVCLPNIVSTSITTALKKAQELLKMRVDFGFEYMVGRNWAECH
jgi:hypothetical protein